MRLTGLVDIMVRGLRVSRKLQCAAHRSEGHHGVRLTDLEEIIACDSRVSRVSGSHLNEKAIASSRGDWGRDDGWIHGKLMVQAKAVRF